jgi:uncharacterized protein (DUF924 family)
MTIDTLLDFWFGTDPDDAVVAKEQAALWWSKNKQTDQEIRSRFEDQVRAAAQGELDPWARTARGRLALIILLDQLPRNIYRETARAFLHDEKALALSLEGLHLGMDRQLRPIERVFFYLPLEHSECLAHQERSVERFSDLVTTVPAEQKSTFEEYLISRYVTATSSSASAVSRTATPPWDGNPQPKNWRFWPRTDHHFNSDVGARFIAALLLRGFKSRWHGMLRR